MVLKASPLLRKRHSNEPKWRKTYGTEMPELW